MTPAAESADRIEGVAPVALHENLLLYAFGPVELVRIRREEALGALSAGILEALQAYVAGLATRQQVRAVVFTGTGRAFVAGADINIYHGASAAAFNAYQRISRRLFDGIANLDQITVAALNGYALGGGFELALACDFIFMADKAKVGLPEIKLGLLPGGGGTQRLPRLVGAMRAKEMVLTGRMLSAEESKACGIALDVFPPEELVGKALAYAQTVSAQAPLALVEGKRVIDDGQDTALTAGLTLEQRVLGALYASDDAKEGIAAFVEKRQPAFHGK